MNVSLKGKSALITGVTRRIGIGAAIAEQFATAGADLVVAYFRPYDQQMEWGVAQSEPEEIIEQLRRHNGRVVGFEVDLATLDGPQQLFERATAALGTIDILVNNATYSTQTNFNTLTAAELDKHYAVNLRANALLCTLFARQTSLENGGRIINLTSGQGLHPMPEELAYAATKAAAETLATSLAPDLAKFGITINTVDPGVTDTGWMSAELKQHFTAASPMGRVSVPDDAARLITFLASDQAAWITGQVIRSRGGL